MLESRLNGFAYSLQKIGIALRTVSEKMMSLPIKAKEKMSSR